MRWTFRVTLPPPLNHQYIYPVDKQGHAHPILTKEAKQWKEDTEAVVPFTANIKKKYSVLLWVCVPTDNSDLDGRLKLLLDSVFGSRCDHRVYSLLVRKRVARDDPHITCRIIEW